MKIIFVLVALFVSLNAFSDTVAHSGKISKIMFFANDWGTYSEVDDGVMVFYMNPALPKACETGDNRVAIGIKHPLYQSIVSSVLAAKLAGTDVKIKYIDECTKRSNSWDFGYISLE